VLREMARILREGVRETDTIAGTAEKNSLL